MIDEQPQAQLQRTTWPPSTEPDGFLTSFGIQPVGPEEQPGLGIGIYWNNPEDRRRPFVSVQLWRWILCIGWLIDDRRR